MRLLFLIMTFVICTPAFACFGGGGDDPPPPSVVRITGENASCDGTAFTYQVEAANADFLDLVVTGGSIIPVSAPQISVCGGIPAPTPITGGLRYNPANGSCTFVVSVRITWNSSGTRRLTATAVRGGTSQSRTLTFTGSTPTISGPPSPICLSGFGGSSFFFNSTGPPGATIQWSAVSFPPGGPAATIASPNSPNTSISGFVPGSFYTISVTYTCPGQAAQTRSLSIQTLNFDDPECGFLDCPEPDILCRQQAEKEFKERYGELSTLGYVPNPTDVINTEVSVDLMEEVQTLSIYPNPVRASEALTVRLPGSTAIDAQPTMVRVLDINGRIVYQAEVSQPTIQLTLPDVPPGSYVVQTIRGREINSTKLLVNSLRP